MCLRKFKIDFLLQIKCTQTTQVFFCEQVMGLNEIFIAKSPYSMSIKKIGEITDTFPICDVDKFNEIQTGIFPHESGSLVIIWQSFVSLNSTLLYWLL